MGGQPADHRREVAQEVERQNAFAEIPPAAFGHHRAVHLATVLLDNGTQIVTQRLVKRPVMDDKVSFQIQRQAQRVEVTGADRRPVVVHQRHFAVQWPTLIFENLHSAF